MKIIRTIIFICVVMTSLIILAACDPISTPQASITATLDPFDDIEADQVNVDSITQPFAGLEDKLRANEAATFGGLYDQGPQWVIYFTANGDQTTRKYIPAENMFQVKVRESKFTIVQLETAQQDSLLVFSTSGITTSSDIDLLMQRVIIYVKSADVAKATSLKNDPSNAIPYYVDVMDIVQRPSPAPWLQ